MAVAQRERERDSTRLDQLIAEQERIFLEYRSRQQRETEVGFRVALRGRGRSRQQGPRHHGSPNAPGAPARFRIAGAGKSG